MTEPRSFLFLQGLATDFFVRLGDALAARGHSVRRVNFNAGDARFWPRPGSFDYTGHPADWPRILDGLLVAHGVTDLVMFSDCRPLHAAAIPVAQLRGVTVWVFEEGYLRPGYVTLEQEGVNGNSALPRDPDRIRRLAATLPPALPEVLSSGPFHRRALDDMRYNWASVTQRRRFPHWRTHRSWHPFHEYAGWAWRGVRRPGTMLLSRLRQRGILSRPGPLFLFPLQLEGDTQIRVWSPFRSITEAIAGTIASFARHAPPTADLILKGHPLDNGLVDWRGAARRAAREHGVAHRVHTLAEVAYGPLLAASRGVVTVNSTAGLQALREGKRVVTLGTAVYDLPGLTFQHGLDRFWTEAEPPDMALVDALRRVLAAHCLIRGGFFEETQVQTAVDAAVERMTLRQAASTPQLLARG
ncbi:MAG TPA: capsular biosynthesis protein [Acetobacteraceae bacterium]|nr:capsular biosynthesis protein [Acetobacteraceae bacterium]